MFVLAGCLASLSLVCPDDHNHGEEVEVEQETQLQTHHVILIRGTERERGKPLQM